MQIISTKNTKESWILSETAENEQISPENSSISNWSSRRNRKNINNVSHPQLSKIFLENFVDISFVVSR